MQPKKFKLHLGITGLAVGLCTWMAIVCYFIATEPNECAKSIEEAPSDVTNSIVRRHNSVTLPPLTSPPPLIPSSTWSSAGSPS